MLVVAVSFPGSAGSGTIVCSIAVYWCGDVVCAYICVCVCICVCVYLCVVYINFVSYNYVCGCVWILSSIHTSMCTMWMCMYF